MGTNGYYGLPGVTETLRVDEVGLVGQVELVRPKKGSDFWITDLVFIFFEEKAS